MHWFCSLVSGIKSHIFLLQLLTKFAVDGSLIDVISLAMRGALKTLRLPKISPVKSALLESLDFNVEDDPTDPIYLDIEKIPVRRAKLAGLLIYNWVFFFLADFLDDLCIW